MKPASRCLLATLALILCTASVRSDNNKQASVSGSKDKAPWFCHDLDCPSYKVLNKTDSYEIRKLEGGKWAATKVEALLYSVGISTGFQRLFKYISGENEEKTKIEMTAPVVTRVTPGQGPFCKSLFSVHFFVPFADQDSPPSPTNPDVHIEDADSEVFAVLQFGGFLVDDFTLSAKAASLQESLVANGVKFENDSFFTAGYDPPFRLQHRHNEIWLRLVSEEDSGSQGPFDVAAKTVL